MLAKGASSHSNSIKKHVAEIGDPFVTSVDRFNKKAACE